MCIVLLPSGVKLIAVSEFIIWGDDIKMGLEEILLTGLGWLTIGTSGGILFKIVKKKTFKFYKIRKIP
jgi:hypothetical protein